MSLRISPEEVRRERDEFVECLKIAREAFALMNPSEAKYWEHRVQVTILIENLLELEYEIEASSPSFPFTETQWSEYPEALSIIEQLECARFDQRLCTKQVERFGRQISSKIEFRNTYLEFFIQPKNKLGVEAGLKEWLSDRRALFFEELFASYDSRHRTRNEKFWCPMSRRYTEAQTKDKHLFKWERGQEMMTSIFGPSPANEIFSPENGIVLSSQAQIMFNLGLLVLVPDVDSLQSIKGWNQATVKNYKIKVLDPTHYYMRDYVQTRDMRDHTMWWQMDGAKVRFRNDFRPAERFLFWHYCVSVLRMAWVRDRQAGVLEEICREAWPVSGSYMYRSTLLAFEDEMGGGISLLQGAIDRESTSTERNMTGLVAAVDQIRQTAVACNEPPGLSKEGKVLMSCGIEDSDEEVMDEQVMDEEVMDEEVMDEEVMDADVMGVDVMDVDGESDSDEDYEDEWVVVERTIL